MADLKQLLMDKKFKEKALPGYAKYRARFFIF